MKECPKCHIRVNATSICPACDYDLTNEPESEFKTEKYPLNKYFFRFLKKYCKFQIVCTVLFIALAVYMWISSRGLYWNCILSGLILIIFMWLETLLKSFVHKFRRNPEPITETYFETNNAAVYLSGTGAVFLAALPTVFKFILNLLN